VKDALMQYDNLRIDLDRLIGRIRQLGEIGALESGGVCRLALTDEDCNAAFVDAAAKS